MNNKLRGLISLGATIWLGFYMLNTDTEVTLDAAFIISMVISFIIFFVFLVTAKYGLKIILGTAKMFFKLILLDMLLEELNKKKGTR